MTRTSGLPRPEIPEIPETGENGNSGGAEVKGAALLPSDVIRCKPVYASLADVLNRAFAQAATGKGAERHAQGQPFERQPEPDRVATKTLTGLTWTRTGDDSIRFTFRDQVAGDVATEVWMFAEDGRLDGIEVI